MTEGGGEVRLLKGVEGSGLGSSVIKSPTQYHVYLPEHRVIQCIYNEIDILLEPASKQALLGLMVDLIDKKLLEKADHSESGKIGGCTGTCWELCISDLVPLVILNYLKEQTLYKLKVKIYSVNDPTSGIRACVETLNKKNSIHRMRQYICHTDHNLWDVIVNGDLEEEPAPTGETSPPAPKTAKQLAAKRNQERILNHSGKRSNQGLETLSYLFPKNISSILMKLVLLVEILGSGAILTVKIEEKSFRKEQEGTWISKSRRNQRRRSYGDNCKPVNYALMAISSSSSSSSSDNEGYELALESLESRILGHEKNELAWGEKYEFQNYELKCREIKINNLNTELEKVVKERDELKLKIEKWEESSKNLDELLNSQMSARDKTGLGYGTQLNEMSNNSKTDSEISLSVFDVRSSDEESTPANDRSSKADGYHVVPPPITGNFLTPRADISFAGLDEYAIRKKIIESKTTDLNTKTSETVVKEEGLEAIKGNYFDHVSNYMDHTAQKGQSRISLLQDHAVVDSDELKFNLFSVLQMCDKKNSVLFTESEYPILSPSFKLLDESQVVLRAPRKDDVYNWDLKNIVPSRGVTCLYANATADESKLWHRRLADLVRCANVTEFKNHAMNEFCAKKGIKREFSVAKTPRQNML
ncbi:hypothetical protein Tco_0695226 [Tanacetum coccineum]